MGTNDSSVGIAALELLQESGIPFLILHHEPEIAAGAVKSDIDIATACHPVHLLGVLLKSTTEAQITPIQYWEYDVNAASIFLADRETGQGAQLDVMGDPDGWGHYGLRSDVALEQACQGTRWPILNPLDQMLYLLRKGHIKGQAARLSAALGALGGFDHQMVSLRLSQLFSRRAASALESLLCQRTPPRAIRGGELSARAAAAGRHIAFRSRTRTGFWLATKSETQLELTAHTLRPLRGLLPAVSVCPSVSAVRRVKIASSIRWPGLVISSTAPGHYCGPTATLPDSAITRESILEATLDAMRSQCHSVAQRSTH